MLKVYTHDPQDEIARGARSDVVVPWNKWGYRDFTLAANNRETIWATQADNVDLQVVTTAQTFTITYNSGTDGSGTTGATVLLIDYLDGDNRLQQATHLLGSTGSDVTAFQGLGINRIAVAANGGDGLNNSEILLTATTDSTVQGIVPAQQGVTQQAILHCPIGYRPVVKYISLNADRTTGGGSPNILFQGWAYSRIVNGTFEVFRHYMDTAAGGLAIYNDLDFPLSARDVFYITASTSANDTLIACRFKVNLYKEIQ